jgi:hypothetical protein
VLPEPAADEVELPGMTGIVVVDVERAGAVVELLAGILETDAGMVETLDVAEAEVRTGEPSDPELRAELMVEEEAVLLEREMVVVQGQYVVYVYTVLVMVTSRMCSFHSPAMA